MVVFRLLVVFVMGLALSLSSSSVGAAEPKNKGLFITPLRQEITVNAGKDSSGYFTVGNLTETGMTVTLDVQQFSVADYTYDYKFRTPPKYNWVSLKDKKVTLKPSETKKIWYDIRVPEKASPGGYYFSLVASTTISQAGIANTVQAATLLYAVVDGNLIRTSVFQNDTVPFLVMGSEVPYEFDIKNTGNVHFSAYLYGQVDTLFYGKQSERGTSHILMPGAIRSINGAVPSPLLPGIYRLDYGYKVDFASIITTRSAYFVFIPPWSIVALIVAVVLGRWLWRSRRKHS